MRKIAIAVALALSVSLGGCAQITGLLAGQSIASTAPATMADAEKALTLAHLAYQGVGQLLISSAQSGLLHGAAAGDAKVYYDQAGTALDFAEQARSVADAPGVMSAVSQAQGLILQAKALIPTK